VVHALGDLVFLDPDGRQWQTADRYLSGDVVKKLEDARTIARDDKTYQRNVEALEKVQPLPLSRHDIYAAFGAPWVPAAHYEAFFKDVLGASTAKVERVPITGEFKVSLGTLSRDAFSKYGTERVEPIHIARAAINNRQVTVYDEGPDNTRVVNAKATEEARIRTEALKEAFSGDLDTGGGWVWTEEARAQELEAIYNRTYNNLVPRKFDGSHLTFPGLNRDFATRQHRKDAVWRMVQQGNTLLAHVVGSGKTVTMIAGGMEMKRLGLINKPAYVVPNHMLEQFSREFIQAYPNAKILVASKDETSAENRKAFVAKVASNDWDGVIITHDAFGRLNMGKEFRRQHISDQLDELDRAIDASVAEGDRKSPTVKELEKVKKRLKDKLDKLMNEERKDEGVTFEETGIDHLFVDEAHKFKNLSFITRLTRVKGLSNTASQRAEDLFLKMRYLEGKRPNRSAVFATGTPVSNTMAELWTMMRYLQLDRLKQRDLEVFDSWASTFGRVQSNMELSADGRTMQEVSSFSRFVNIPELIGLYSEIADTKTADMLNLPRPEVRTRSGAPGVRSSRPSRPPRKRLSSRTS
jgi:N12 class adenine-specific DNA methylase